MFSGDYCTRSSRKTWSFQMLPISCFVNNQILVWLRKCNCIAKNWPFGADCGIMASSGLISFEMRQEIRLPSIANVITQCWPTFFSGIWRNHCGRSLFPTRRCATTCFTSKHGHTACKVWRLVNFEKWLSKMAAKIMRLTPLDYFLRGMLNQEFTPINQQRSKSSKTTLRKSTRQMYNVLCNIHTTWYITFCM